jgi:hypothetical protein
MGLGHLNAGLVGLLFGSARLRATGLGALQGALPAQHQSLLHFVGQAPWSDA